MLSRAMRALAGTAILGLLGWWLGAGPFLDALHEVNGATLAGAVAIGALTTVLSAWRWALVARGLGARLPLPAAVGGYYRALFLNAVLPGGVLGDVQRAVRHGRAVGDVALAVKAVVLERAAGQVVLVTVGVTVLLLEGSAVPLPRSADADVVITRVLPGVALAVGAVIAAGVAARRRRSRWAGSMRTWADDARRGLTAPGIRVGILLASLGVLAGHLATFLLASRAAGSTLPLARLAPLALVALLAMTLPVNVGGWGPREGATAWAFAGAGLAAAQGLTIAVVYGVFVLAASLPGAAVLAAGWIAEARADLDPQPAAALVTTSPPTTS